MAATIEQTDQDYEITIEDEARGISSSLIVPVDLLATEILKSVRLYTSIHLDGTVNIESDDGLVGNGQKMMIDDLVITSISPAMCEDEPEAGPMLRQLAERLKVALAAVDEALKRV